MQGIILLVSLIALTSAGVKDVTQQYSDLFKYSPNDVYTLSQDVDDEKPPVVFHGPEINAKTEVFENINHGDKFKLQLKTQNGIDVEQVGKLKDSKTFVISGQYSFTGADGKRYTTRYTADEFGYHPRTELDLDIPEAIPQATPVKQNPFKFLNQNLANQGFFDRTAANGAAQTTPGSFTQDTINVPYSPSEAQYENPGGSNLQGNGYDAGFIADNASPSGNEFGPLRGSGQSGDDYSYGPQDLESHAKSGYNYNAPSLQYLPPSFQ